MGTSTLANDDDVDGDSLTGSVVTGPSHGTLVWNPNGTFDYTPDTAFVGTDSFTYQVSDGVLTSGTATVTIEVLASNAKPVAEDLEYTVDNDDAIDVDAPGLLDAVNDLENDALQVVIVTPPRHGTLVLEPDGSFRYVPDLTFAGQDQFEYRATDDFGQSNVATVVIDVRANVGAAPPTVDVATADQSPEEDESKEDSETTELPQPMRPTTDDDEDADAFMMSGMQPMVRRNEGNQPTTIEGSMLLDAGSPDLRTVRFVADRRADGTSSTSNRAEFELASEIAPLFEEVAMSLYAPAFDQALDALQDAVTYNYEYSVLAVGSAFAATGSISVGYVLWMLRGGYLMGSLLSSMPVWRIVDPLPVLDILDKRQVVGLHAQDDESLETIIEQSAGPA